MKKSNIKNNKNNRIIFLVILSICIAGIIATGANLYLQLRAQMSQQNYLTAVAKFSDKLNNLQDNVNQILQYKEKNIDNWSLIKSYYALQTAKFYLANERNIDSALKILTETENNLAKLQKLADVRNALLLDIAALKTANKIDTIKIALQLETLSQDLIALKDRPKALPEENKPIANNAKTNNNVWQTFLEKSKIILEKAFIIHHHDSALVLLNIDQKYSLILNMQSQLKTAEWALLHNEDLLYQSNLKQVVTDLKNYFLSSNPSQTSKILLTLQELQKISLSTPLPNLDKSEQAIQIAITK